MANPRISTKLLLAFCGACGALYCGAPTVAGIAAGMLLEKITPEDIKKFAGGLFGHLGGGLVEKWCDHAEKHALPGRNHDLRKLLILAIHEELDDVWKEFPKKGWGSTFIQQAKEQVAKRLEEVVDDENYRQIMESELPEFFTVRPDAFADLRALTEDRWFEFLGGNSRDIADVRDSQVRADMQSAVRTAARALHTRLPLRLVTEYRKSFDENPEIYVAVQTSLSQLIIEELRNVGADVKHLEALTIAYQQRFEQFSGDNLAAMQGLATAQHELGREFQKFLVWHHGNYRNQRALLERIAGGQDKLVELVTRGNAESAERDKQLSQQLHEHTTRLEDAIVKTGEKVLVQFKESLKTGDAARANTSPTPILTSEELSIKTITYLKRLSNDTAHIELRNIKNVPLLALPVEQAYVPLRGVPLRGRGQARQEDEGREVDVQLKEVLAKFGPRVAIIGGAGSGKSTVLQHMAWVLASAASKPVNGQPDITTPHDVLGLAVTPNNMPVPIFAPLPKLQSATNSAALKNELNRYLTAEKHYDLPEGYVESLLKAGRVVVLLLDGLDEVASDPMRATLRKAIDELAREYPANLYIAVTCRTVAYAGQTPLKEGFNIVNVKPLEPADVENLITQAGQAMTGLGFSGDAIATAL